VIGRREGYESVPEGGTIHRHELVLNSWRKQGEQKILDVPEPVYQMAQPGGTLTLRIRPGRFHHGLD
jgi:hypothetical protein